MIAARPPTPIVALPLWEWPDWPHYNGGDAKNATSYSCVKGSQNAPTESVRTAP